MCLNAKWYEGKSKRRQQRGWLWCQEGAMQGSVMEAESLTSREKRHLLLYSLSEVSNKQTIEESFHF